MKKIILAIFLILTILISPQMLVSETKPAGLEIKISKLNAGELKKTIDDRLGSREASLIESVSINDGSINNDDFKYLSEDLSNLKFLDLSNTTFSEKEVLVSFNKKSKLEFLSLPKSKEGYKLVDNFLKDNENIEELHLNGVNSIGKFAFENTKKLYNIDLSKVKNLSEGGLINSGIEMITFSKNYDLPKSFLKNTKSLSVIDLSHAQTIGKEALMGSGVTTVVMPDSYALEGSTFVNTKNLSEIDLSGATRLGEADFKDSSIESITFPRQYAIPDYYFLKTNKLKSIDISNATSIGVGAFAYSSIEAVVLPKTYTLSEGLFQNTTNLLEIDVSGATKIEDAVFAGSKLSKIILPEKFEVSNTMFGFMEDLKSIDLSGAQFIGSDIFAKAGNNYDFYRKLYDGDNLKSNIKEGIETVILGGFVPSITADSFANLNKVAPLILMPASKEWDGLNSNLMAKENEITDILRYEAYTYRDLMISKNTSIQIGFLNPSLETKDDQDKAVQYQWYYNDNEITNGNQSTFTIDNFSINDEGLYKLVIKIDDQEYELFSINLEANELAINSDTLAKGFFVDEKIDKETVEVLYVKDDIRQEINPKDLQYDYDFSDVGNTSIKVTYTKDDLQVVADYPVKVAETLPEVIKIKKGKDFIYDPKIDSFEFILTSQQKEAFNLKSKDNKSEVIITGKEKYKGELDFKFNDRVGQVEIEIVNNYTWLWISLSLLAVVSILLVVYLRNSKGMFKSKKSIEKNQ